jgi:hypothetical protein
MLRWNDDEWNSRRECKSRQNKIIIGCSYVARGRLTGYDSLPPSPKYITYFVKYTIILDKGKTLYNIK